MTILHGAEMIASALFSVLSSESDVDAAGRGDDVDETSSSEDLEGRIERRGGENRGSAGMLLKAKAAVGKERRRNVRFIELFVWLALMHS